MVQKYTGNVTTISKDSKTIGIQLIFYRKHPKYGKIMKIIKKKQVHNEKFSLKIGDEITIKASKPYSATKRFIVIDNKKIK